MTPSRGRRRGYALLLVMGFLMVLLAAWGVAYRSVGSAVRVELARSLRRTRDDGTMTALGRGVALLQTGLPKDAEGSDLVPPESYVCFVQLAATPAPRWFAVAFTPGDDPHSWTVRAYAVDQGGLPLMPETFATP